MDGVVYEPVTALLPLVQFLAFSILATDCAQSLYWINGTPEKPVQIGDWLVWEANPLVAGRPDMLEASCDMVAALYEAAPRMLSPPLALVAVSAVAALEAVVVIHNDKVIRAIGIPRKFAVAYQVTF